MKFYFGNFTSENAEFEITRYSRQFILGEIGFASRMRIDWGLRGKIVRNQGQSAVFQRLSQIQQAFQQGPRNNAGFLDDSGNQLLAWTINWADTIGGIQVMDSASHDRVWGAMGLTYLYFNCNLTAEMYAAPGIMRYEETVTFDDICGGPITVERIPLQGDPIIQRVSDASFYYARQVGRVSTNYANPQRNPPYWPSLQRGRPGTREDGFLPTKYVRGMPIEWTRSWRYEFVSTQPFNWAQTTPF